MTHVSLDSQDEAVQRFVLNLVANPTGSVLELHGQPVACIVPPPRGLNGGVQADWTDEKNARRIDLIKRKYADGLSPTEQVELLALQDEMLRFRQKIAPLPLEEARRLHQELLVRATAQARQQ
jgi:hypothetical protein